MTPITIVPSTDASPEKFRLALPVNVRETTDLFPDRWPILVRALFNETKARSPRIEWIVPGKDADADEKYPPLAVWTNYCQIVRTKFRDGEIENALLEHLDTIENILLDGKPSIDAPRTCGGVRHFLGREPRAWDTIRFRPLRSTTLRTRINAPGETRVDDLLTEFSVEVIASG